jgi:hypothetical protein
LAVNGTFLAEYTNLFSIKHHDFRDYFSHLVLSCFAKIIMDPFPAKTLEKPGRIVKRVYLCRHGETSANASGLMQGSGIDLGLNHIGIQQARQLRNYLTTTKFDIAISSKLIVI